MFTTASRATRCSRRCKLADDARRRARESRLGARRSRPARAARRRGRRRRARRRRARRALAAARACGSGAGTADAAAGGVAVVLYPTAHELGALLGEPRARLRAPARRRGARRVRARLARARARDRAPPRVRRPVVVARARRRSRPASGSRSDLDEAAEPQARKPLMRHKSFAPWLVALVVFGPFAAARCIYYASAGPRLAAASAGLARADRSRRSRRPPGWLQSAPRAGSSAYRWSLIYARMAACEQQCGSDLDRLRQVQVALGRDTGRVQRVYLHGGDAAGHSRSDGLQDDRTVPGS